MFFKVRWKSIPSFRFELLQALLRTVLSKAQLRCLGSVEFQPTFERADEPFLKIADALTVVDEEADVSHENRRAQFSREQFPPEAFVWLHVSVVDPAT